MSSISAKIERLATGIVGRLGVAAQEIGGAEVARMLYDYFDMRQMTKQ